MKGTFSKIIAAIAVIIISAFLYVMAVRNVQGEYMKRVAVEKSRNDLPVYRRMLNNALRFKPNQPEAHIDLANTYIHAGEYEKAVSEVLEASKVGQLSISAHKTLGVIYIQKEELEKAEKTLKKALVQSPDNPEVLEYLALINMYKKNYAAALDQLDRATRRDYARPNSYFLYGKIYEMSDIEDGRLRSKAFDYFRRAMQCYKEEEKLLFNPDRLRTYINSNAPE